jgi:vacuolar-type H+-ATPase subunit I/STV1
MRIALKKKKKKQKTKNFLNRSTPHPHILSGWWIEKEVKHLKTIIKNKILKT